MWAPRLLLIDQPLFGQRLAWRQLDALASLALNSNLRKTGKVLAHVQYEQAVALLLQRLLYRIALHDFHRLCYLFAQYTLGRFLHDHRFPRLSSF